MKNRKIFAIVGICLTILFLPEEVFATYSFPHTTGSTTGANSASSLLSITAVGDLEIACGAANQGTLGAPSVSSTNAPTWHQIGSTQTGNGTGGNTLATSCWCAVANSTTADNITYTATGSTFVNVQTVDVVGAAASCTPDAANQAAAPSSTATVSVPSIPTTCSSDVLILWIADPNQSAAPTLATGYTAINGSNGYMNNLSGDLGTAGAGVPASTYTPGATLASADIDWTAHLFAMSSTGGPCTGSGGGKSGGTFKIGGKAVIGD